jgi:hypothetical protein
MNENARNKVIALPDPEVLAVEAAERFVQLAQATVGTNGRFSVALAGGGTAQATYRLLAQSPRRGSANGYNVLSVSPATPINKKPRLRSSARCGMRLATAGPSWPPIKTPGTVNSTRLSTVGNTSSPARLKRMKWAAEAGSDVSATIKTVVATATLLGR